ncbi:cilia- and flagella-associated protein 43 [Latimeria chalumnae]|uniref:cilia- and flagella-associated protein 43 n=1 Tax=Latimeria chalumnae TaxID=7897 RepID=UPI00313C31DC
MESEKEGFGQLQVRWVQGFNNQRASFVNNNTVCYPCGNYIIFTETDTRNVTVLQCPGGRVGAFGVNGSCHVVAFSEQKLNPSIYVYTFPGLVKRVELKGGTKLDYTLLTFSYSGSYLASYSSLPDYALGIWNWQEGVCLCSKSQPGVDITSLTFNPLNWYQLCLANSHSLTVWNVERSDSIYHLKPISIELPVENVCEDGPMSPAYSSPTPEYPYYNPELPISAIAGLMDERAETFMPKETRRPLVRPVSHCWTSTSDIYVGCESGHLLLVNPETQAVTVLSTPEKELPRAGAEQETTTLKEGSLNAMAVNTEGLYVAGSDGILRCLQIKGSTVKVEDCWDAEAPIESIEFPPEYNVLSVATQKGSVHIYEPSQPKVASCTVDACFGNYVSVALLAPGDKYCVTAKELGDVQVLSLEDGAIISTLHLGTQATSLACCPLAHCAAVGTASGHIYFIDLTKIEKPRIVQRAFLYKTPVQYLHYDQTGAFLLTGSTDGSVFVINGKPSKAFQVIGYTVVGGKVLGLSTQYKMKKQQVTVLVLVCPEDRDPANGGTVLEMFVLPSEISTHAAKYTDHRGVLNDTIPKLKYEVADPLSSIVLLNHNCVYGYCSETKLIHRYVLNQVLTNDTLTPEKQAEGHQLAPGLLLLSPHQLWLISAAKDGLIRIQDASSLEIYAQAQCHSYQTGGIQSMVCSTDCQTLLTTGQYDRTLVSLTVEYTEKQKTGTAFEYLFQQLSSIPLQNTILESMPEWTAATASACESPEESKSQSAVVHRFSIDVTEQEESYCSLPSITSPSLTWVDQRLQEAIIKESQKYADKKKNLKKGIKTLRKTIQNMMRENELLPDIEKLEHHEFNLNLEEQEKLQALGEQEVAKAREAIELENLAMCYLRELIQQECWDSMTVKGRTIKAFHSTHEVKNYPIRMQSKNEVAELERVLRMKKVEIDDRKARKEIVEVQAKAAPEKEEEELEEESKEEGVSLSLMGSLSSQCGGSNPFLYSQFELFTKEEKINQIVLLQNIICEVKKTFNREFDTVFRQKEQEVVRVKERNQRIQEIMSDLELNEKIWLPGFTDDEKPERSLVVDDSEIKVEKFLTPEQKAKAEEQARIEEERRLANKSDNARERALNDMMGGVLEVKKEDLLKMEIPPPPCVSKPETEWAEEDRRQFREYEKKVKELSEEREKYRKTLEAELKKLLASIHDSTQAFDEALHRLFERKVKSEMAIFQEELKLANIVFSLLINEEINNRETELNHLLERLKNQKIQSTDMVQRVKAQVEAFSEAYDTLVAEDKLLDRGFRKEFLDVSAIMVDHLYKLYKRRPRVQRRRTHTDSISPLQESPGSARAASATYPHLMKAMDELDAPENMPENLDLPIWQRFCLARRAKVESEQQIKQKALTLAEMQAFLQRRTEEDEKINQDTDNIMRETNVLREKKMKFQLNLTVQFLFKQGQVEVDNGDFIADYRDSILLHRSVVEDLNGVIKTLGEQKIASMIESKDFRKGIVQLEWEHKKMQMEMEDLNNKARDIQNMKMTKDILKYLNDPDYESGISKQIAVLEKTIQAQEKHHIKNVNRYKRILKDLKQHIKHKEKENKKMDEDLQEMLVSTSERKHIYTAIAAGKNTQSAAEIRYQDIVQRRKLVDLARAQTQEVAVLRAEVERLRMKTFPALVQMESQTTE